MGSLTNKLKVILWKSYIIRKRHWLLTIFEIAAPLLLYYMFNKYGPSEKGKGSDYEIGNVQDLNQLIADRMYSRSMQIAYAPNTSDTNEFVSALKSQLKSNSYEAYYKVDYFNFSSEKLLSEWLHKDKYNPDQLIGIVFKEFGPKNGFQYKIKIHQAEIIPQEQRFGLPYEAETYIRNMFVIMQMILDTAFIKKVTGKTYDISLQSFPMKSMSIGQVVNGVFPFVTAFSFIFIIPAIIRKIVEEKITGIKELQKMMGLQYWMWWGGWLVHSLVVYGISICVITWIFNYPWENRYGTLLYEIDSWAIVLYLFFLFVVATILFCFAVSTFFTSPNLAMISGILLWIVPPVFLAEQLLLNTPMNPLTQMMTCLSPPLCLSWGFSIFMNMQLSGEVWSWNSFFTKATSGGLSTAHIVLMFHVDWLIFAFITWYVSSIKPGPYGRAKPLYFILQFWKRDKEIISFNDDETQLNFEPAPVNTKAGISIQNIRKVFGSKVAVDKVNLDVYEGEIMALLGHNGAGKTTTMSIITGLFSPSMGKVVVNGRSIFDNMDKFQQNLGLCPQHNLLFSYFTVIEHLILFGMLKGISSEMARSMGIRLLSVLRMEDKKDQFPEKISGGMKRKLCLAVALMGDPKVLMLDEPTAGMDPESRREVWDILLSYRGDRTIIITTHFMEEADVLGDRIAIMDHGRVSCYGTSIFLKKLYGTGYHVTISKDNSSAEAAITSVVEGQLPGSKLKSILPTQLTYNLSSNDTAKFAPLFSALEKQKSQLGITAIGITCTTMEDVFLRVAEIGVTKAAKHIPSEELICSLPTASTNNIRVSGVQLAVQQLRALLFKKVIFIQRTWLSSVIFTLFPLLAVCFAMRGISLAGSNQEPLSEKISLKHLYPGSEVPYTISDNPSQEKVFKTFVTQQGSSTNKFFGNINQDLISNVEADSSYYRKAVVAAEFNKTTWTALYNSFASHSIPVAINLMSNAILRSTDSSSSIVVFSHPFTSVTAYNDECSLVNNLRIPVQMLYVAISWVMVALGVSLAVARAMSLHISERATGVKQLQLMSSLPSVLYWLAHFLLDFSFYFISILVAWTAIWILDTSKDFVGSGKMYILFFVFLLYGISAIPFVYVISFITKSSPKAMTFILMFNIITGMVFPLIDFIIEASYDMTGWKYELASTLCHINPLYSETAALIRLAMFMVMESKCAKCPQMCSDAFNESMEKTFYNIRNHAVLSMSECILFWLLILAIEQGLLKAGWAKLSTIWIGPLTQHAVLEDEDVRRERERTKVRQNGSVLRVCGLGKKYTRSLVAVGEASFVVEKGECFGLLGVNGAGKTTTFMMLTGEITPTVGTASILQHDLIREKTKYLQEIGYCPQFNALIEVLTGEELLRLFAALRGIDNIDTEVRKWIQFMGLEEFRKVQCGKYSGGNKRKLSTAIAMIGDLPVVFLDEPTAGVDPVSRRKLWNVLAQCQRKGQVIVLTSHSMEECEALCSRLTIMVGGHMKCIGSSQHLKQRFGQGYTIMLKLSATCPDFDTALIALKSAISQVFPNCFIKDEHKGLLHYHLVDNRVPLSQLFGHLETIREAHPLVEDYTVGDTTLEQVFMSFARQERSATPAIV